MPRFISEHDALKVIQKYPVDISPAKHITVKGSVGLRGWGAISFLCNNHNYFWSKSK